MIKPVDYSIPEGPMPLNPIIGACSPVRPDVELHFADGEIAGTATFTKRFVGPPGYAHGGISAMLADQIVAGQPDGHRRAHRHQFARRCAILRPLPLDEEVELWGVCEPDGEQLQRQLHGHRPRQGRGRRAPPSSCTFENFAAPRRASPVERASSSAARRMQAEARVTGQGATASGVWKPVGR